MVPSGGEGIYVAQAPSVRHVVIGDTAAIWQRPYHWGWWPAHTQYSKVI